MAEGWHAATIALGVAAITAVGGVGGYALRYIQHDREMNVRMVEIALGILRDESEDIRPAREWAIDVINKHVDPDISGAARQALIDNPISWTWMLAPWDAATTRKYQSLVDAMTSEPPTPAPPTEAGE